MKHINRTSADRSKMFYWQVDRPFSEQEIKDIFLDRHQKFNRQLIEEVILYGMTQISETRAQAKVIELSDPIPFGSVNTVCKAKIADGTSVVVRIHPPEVKNSYFWAESIASQQAKLAGVPTYSTYIIDDSRQKFGFDYMIIERLPGETMKKLWPLPPKVDQQLIQETGMYLAKIHTIKTQQFGFFDNRLAKESGKLRGIHKSWKNHVLAAFISNLEYLTDNNVITSTQSKIVESIISKHANIISCEDPRLVQNDLADWNQLVENNRITGIVDWDECFSGDPVADFSAWSVFFPLERMEHLKRGYLLISPLPDGFTEKFHFYRLRYIVSKLVVRKKKLIFQPNDFMQQLLDFALKILQDELKWYGY